MALGDHFWDVLFFLLRLALESSSSFQKRKQKNESGTEVILRGSCHRSTEIDLPMVLFQRKS